MHATINKHFMTDTLMDNMHFDRNNIQEYYHAVFGTIFLRL